MAQYFELHPENPQPRLLKQAATIIAGGGVVADSDPEAEYQESCNKAKALLHAAEDALNLAEVGTAPQVLYGIAS